VVVRDLDVVCIPRLPAETDAPLVVDPDTVLPGAVAHEFLQAVARWHTQVREINGGIELAELAERDALNVWRKTPRRLSLEEPSGLPVPKAPNHAGIVT
jgi:hypothetical protein